MLDDKDMDVDVESAEVAEAADEDTWSGNRADIGKLVEADYDNRQAETTLRTLASKAEITLEDLKTLPEARGIDDEQLQKMWDEANKSGVAEAPPAGEARNWKIFNSTGEEVTDLSKLTAADFLTLQHEYMANGKAQRKTYDELVRNASQGHYNAERMMQLQQDRQQAYTQWKKFEQEAQALTADKQVWLSALDAAARQDYQPIQVLLDAYMAAMGAPSVEGPKMIPAADVELERAGRRMYETTILPKAQEIAAAHGLQPSEVAEAIMYLVEQEPAEFFTIQRLEQIISVEIPHAIQMMKQSATPSAPTPDPRDAKIAELERKLASTHNTQIDNLHQKRKAAPPAPMTLPGGNSAYESPDFASGHDARKWLRELKG